MTTFTASAAASGAFITLTLSALSQDSVVTITRDPSPGDVTVRGTPVELPSGGATVLTDLEFPFGQPITYTAVLRNPSTGATVETLTAAVAAITLPTDGMVVSDPLSNRAVLVTCIDQRDERSTSRSYRFDLAGTSAPLFVSEYPTGWEWLDELLTVDLTDRGTLDALLRGAGPVLLRVNGDCDLRQGWAQPGDIDVQRMTVPASDTRRRWNVQLAEVAAPDSTVEGVAVTLGDLNDMIPGTLQDIDDEGYGSLLALSLAVVDWVGNA